MCGCRSVQKSTDLLTCQLVFPPANRVFGWRVIPIQKARDPFQFTQRGD
jgi:hypothetical protein